MDVPQTDLNHQSKQPHAALFIDLPCSLCGGERFETLLESRYPESIDGPALQKLYRAASDQELLDRLVRCRSCELVQVRPLLKPELILAGYQGEPGDDFVTQNPFRIRTFDRALQDFERRLGRKANPEIQVLDIGCAGGAFPKAAKDRGYAAHGLEPNEYMSEYARREYGLAVETGTDIERAFAGKQFDIITLWDVIEHLVDPGRALRKIRSRLKPDGRLVLNFPDYASWPARWMGKKWPFLLSVHLYYFTPKSLRQLLEKNGFRVEWVKPHFQTLELGYVIQRAIGILPFLKPFGFLSKTRLGKLPFTYYLGQTQVVARPV